MCVCTHQGIMSPCRQHCPGEWVLVVSGGFVTWVGGGRCGSEGQRGDVSVPKGSFSPQENSDVFLSTVDTDWKVGPATGGAPDPWVPHGTAACGWGRLRGAERSQGCCCPPFPWGRSAWSVSVHRAARPSWSSAGGDGGGHCQACSVLALGCGWRALGDRPGTKPL